MKASCVRAIVRKDAIMAMRNKLVLMALIGGVLFSLIYYALPASVEETYALGLYDKGDSELISTLPLVSMGGFTLDEASSEDELTRMVQQGDYVAGIVVPDGFDAAIGAGETPSLSLVVGPDVPSGTIDSLAYIIQTALDYAAHGTPPVQLSTEVVGEDMSGAHVPLREQSIPLYIVLALMMEMWTIATLIVEEGASGTLRAVLVTPATPSDVISAKGIVGGSYSLGVVAVILLLTQSLRGDPLALLVGIVVGALFAVTLGLLLGSLTTNITGSYIYVSVPMLVLLLPALVVLIPDVSLSVIKLIPTYYLVNAFGSILNSGAGLGDVWSDFLLIAVCALAFFVLGVLSLRRRY
jgi:ABC-2 type transport system permease protein